MAMPKSRVKGIRGRQELERVSSCSRVLRQNLTDLKRMIRSDRRLLSNPSLS